MEECTALTAGSSCHSLLQHPTERTQRRNNPGASARLGLAAKSSTLTQLHRSTLQLQLQMHALKRIAMGGRASSAMAAATRATAASAPMWPLALSQLCRRCMSITGFPPLPGPGSFSPLPSPLAQQPLPSADSLPSPLRQHMPPLSARGAGIDSPSRDQPGARADDEDEEDERNRGTGAGPPTPPPVSRRHPGGIEQGGGAGGGGAPGATGLPEPRPRGGISGGGSSGGGGGNGNGNGNGGNGGSVESEKRLHERGPQLPSDTPPLPEAPATPGELPSEQTQLQREAQQRAEDARQVQRAARGLPDPHQAREAILPPPRGSNFSDKSPAEHRASASGFHKTGPADRHHQQVPSDDTDLDNSKSAGPLAAIWRAIKQALDNASGRK